MPQYEAPPLRPAAAVVPYELTGQLESELFRAKRCIVTVTLLKDKCISYGYVKQKMKNIFVKFYAFCSAAVVPPDLVASIVATHEGVVVNDRYSRTILLAPEDSTPLGVVGGGHHRDNLSVHPKSGTYLAFLDGKEVTSTTL